MKRVPLGQLKPAPWNPRTLRDERFKNLCRSIEADPELLDLRPVLATIDGTIYGGNQRYRAVQHLGWKDVPAELSDIPEKLAKERALKDNGSWGEWDDGGLAELLAELKDSSSDLDLLGFDEVILTQALARMDPPTDPREEWQGMPGFEQEDQLGGSAFAVIVHFKSLADKQVFGNLIGQALTERTKYVWYPEEKPADRKSYRWTDES